MTEPLCRRCNHPKGKGDTVATQHCNVVTKKNKPCKCPSFVGPVQRPKKAAAREEKFAAQIELRNRIQQMPADQRLRLYLSLGMSEQPKDVMLLLEKASAEFLKNIQTQLAEWEPKDD